LTIILSSIEAEGGCCSLIFIKHRALTGLSYSLRFHFLFYDVIQLEIPIIHHVNLPTAAETKGKTLHSLGASSIPYE
jgi:hypothetical protein